MKRATKLRLIALPAYVGSAVILGFSMGFWPAIWTFSALTLFVWANNLERRADRVEGIDS